MCEEFNFPALLIKPSFGKNATGLTISDGLLKWGTDQKIY